MKISFTITVRGSYVGRVYAQSITEAREIARRNFGTKARIG